MLQPLCTSQMGEWMLEFARAQTSWDAEQKCSKNVLVILQYLSRTDWKKKRFLRCETSEAIESALFSSSDLSQAYGGGSGEGTIE